VSAEHDALVRLAGLTHDTTRHVSHRTSVLQLYREASDVAEQRLPGPLGVAVAAVLATAAEHRRLSGVGGSLGADQSTMALALAVLEIAQQRSGE
jgi:ribosomal protein S12 methylthiotransferase accessory factor YcaO